MLDDLRHTDDELDDFGGDIEDEVEVRPTVTARGFLGMTAAERMVLSIMVFLAVAVFGVLVLIATGRIAI
jgi:hypothetical protein